MKLLLSDLQATAMDDMQVLDARGYRRAAATMPGYHAGRPPRNRGRRYPADPPTTDELVQLLRGCAKAPSVPAMLAALPHIAAPIVAINPGTAATDVASLRRHGVEPILVEDVGHFPMIEAPDRFNAVLGAALASFGS